MENELECTIFSDQQMNESDSLWYIIIYHPYWIGETRNPDFDKNSGLILDLKEGQKHATEWAFELLNPYLGKDFAISIVPPHEAGKKSPLKDLVRLIVKADSTRIDASDCLVRYKTIEKLAHGGDRSIQVHLDSIKVDDSFIIEDEQVLVLDEVQTSGNSLKACKYLLKQADARIVKCLSISKTAGY